ncbi:methyltransferase domain-containing protein [Nocardia uniformis]|uniref:methyltransferase domain-containing protein n=1 Tax=Nocardia uniformis TaxID=53432 RepID=UPI001BB0D8B1|nr:methyltransferase domain-containing protein [Nocardia uniformis]
MGSNSASLSKSDSGELNSESKDNGDRSVGDGIYAVNAGWSFSGDTVKTFQPHVERSVPFYREAQNLVAQISDFYIRDDSYVYDIGTSLGATLGALLDRHRDRSDVRWTGIDTEIDMVAAAHERFAEYRNVAIVQSDISEYHFEPSDMIVSFYTLQFVPPKYRQDVLHKIYSALNWGGAFVWFEKVRAPDARFQDINTALYNDYKLENGFSPDEIIGKSRSLKGVLEPFSTGANMDLLHRAGFEDVVTVFKYLCFEGYLAVK